MATTKWTLDPTHSELGFKIKHLMISNVSGSFNKFEVEGETKGKTSPPQRLNSRPIWTPFIPIMSSAMHTFGMPIS